MVEAGLTPRQAFKAATIGAAAFLRASASLGRIAPGMEADLLLLHGNPLERIENARRLVAVISDGELVPDIVAAR